MFGPGKATRSVALGLPWGTFILRWMPILLHIQKKYFDNYIADWITNSKQMTLDD